MRLQDHLNVIRHRHRRKEIAAAANAFAMEERINKQTSCRSCSTKVLPGRGSLISNAARAPVAFRPDAA
jgi:hypothetical protein